MPEIFKWAAERGLPAEFLKKIKQILDDGSVIVFPTNTLYGLGASIYSEPGIQRLNELKNRPPGMPLSIMATAAQIHKLCHVTDNAGYFMASGDWRITAIFMARDGAPASLLHNGTIAVRLPCSELTASLVECVGPITATSANIHGTLTPSSIAGVIGQFGDRVPIYIDAGPLNGAPTTLIDYTGAGQRIIREGAMSAAEAGKAHGR